MFVYIKSFNMFVYFKLNHLVCWQIV